MSTAVYAGSFDPVTLGHLDIIKRASGLFDKLYVCVVPNSGKHPMFSSEERVSLIERLTRGLPNVVVDASSDLVVRYARGVGANVLIRGLRTASDFEPELRMSIANGKVEPGTETLFLASSEEYTYLSSSVVKEMAKYGADISAFVPKEIIDEIYAKAKKWR